MQDGCAASAESTPTLFRCQMVCRLVKLNGLFEKKSVCKGATTVAIMALMPFLVPPWNSSAADSCNAPLTVLQLFFFFLPIEIPRWVIPCLFLIAAVEVASSWAALWMQPFFGSPPQPSIFQASDGSRYFYTVRGHGLAICQCLVGPLDFSHPFVVIPSSKLKFKTL